MKKRAPLTRSLLPVCAAFAALLLVLLSSPRWRGDKLDRLPPLRSAAAQNYTGWKRVAPCPVARLETQGAGVGSKLYLLGGYYQTQPKYTGTTRCDVYDTATNVWKAVAPMPRAVTHAGVATDGRYIWMAGGYPLRADGWQDFATCDVNVYDTRNNTWARGVPLPQPRGAGAMVLLGRELHFISGVDSRRADKTDHWKFNVDAIRPAWVPAAPLPAPRNHVAAVEMNGRIYVAGGQQGYNDAFPVATLYIYDPALNRWARGADMPRPRSHNSAGAFVYLDHFCVAGGETSYGKVLSDVIAYSPTTNKWYALPSLPEPRHSPLVQVVGGRIVATDGSNPPVIQTTTWISTGP